MQDIEFNLILFYFNNLNIIGYNFTNPELVFDNDEINDIFNINETFPEFNLIVNIEIYSGRMSNEEYKLLINNKSINEIEVDTIITDSIGPPIAGSLSLINIFERNSIVRFPVAARIPNIVIQNSNQFTSAEITQIITDPDIYMISEIKNEEDFHILINILNTS